MVVLLYFKAFNNEVEYEALLASLQVAKYVGEVIMIIHLDSQLATQQLERTYEVKNDWLRKYIEAYEKIKVEFQEIVLQKILKEENKKADELTLMTSAITQ